MLKTIDGFCYLSFVQSGIRNLAKNKQKLNDLNVFPVPDGDTGTNMLMTLRYGYDAVKTNGHLGDVANQLASYAVFGARGNSGVIVSQFFKGVASSLRDCPTADCSQFAKALVSGYKYAYKAVLKPVEGTMLTVLREAADQLVRDSLDSFDDLVHQYLHYAKQCLQRTPDMLPVLKKAGVVDSGASGIVCFFEGVSSFLTGEEIVIEDQDTPTQNVDLTQFDRHSRFPYGYCIEGVLQLNVEVERFDQARLQGKLASSGDSIVMTIEQDKLKLHVHSKLLAKALDACLEFGEFLTLKIENMTVQNLSKQAATKRFLYNTQPSEFDFAVVAVAPNAYLQQTFFEMGADVVINSEIAPSAQDFIDAFDYTGAKQILVFPNSSNSVLTSVHAGNLYKKGDVTVLNCRSVEECCLSLRLIDFDDGLDRAVKVINKTLAALYKATIYHATKDIYYGKQRVDCNQFFALCDNEIVASGDSVMQVAQRTVAKVLAERDCSVLTIFYGAEMAEEFVKMLADNLQKDYGDLEIACLATEETLCDVVLAFE